eukprot:10932679-Alexandrium_andersonii.AAC.1
MPFTTGLGENILRCEGWALAGKSRCTFIQARPGEVLRCGPGSGMDQRTVPPTGAPSSAPAAGTKRT